MVTILKETVGREALLALARYQSVTQALAEIIDNPFDYRRNRHLTVNVQWDRSKGVLQVLEFGGEGMDNSGLADWIQWGTGHQHRTEDIGQWHVGGKLAAIYLAESLEIICRRANDAKIYRFTDPRWGSRTTFFQGRPQTLEEGHLSSYPALSEVPPGTGFTLLIMRRLKPHRRYERATLVSYVANTYRTLLARNLCRILVDGEEVAPRDLPESSVFDPIEIPPTRLDGGVTVRGRLWALDHDRIPARRGLSIKPGVRTVFNGRLITEGEEFGYNISGRNALLRLTGEVELQHIRPNATKSDWDKDSPEWEALEEFMNERMRPLVTFLNQLAESRPISRDQRKRAERVRNQVSEVFRRLLARGTGHGDLTGETDEPGGRKAPEQHEPRLSSNPRSPGIVVNRTEPPPDAVGRLLRRFRGGIPRLDFDDLGRGMRSSWRRSENGEYVIVVNTAFPLYAEIGETESYLAETLLRHLLEEPLEGEVPSLEESRMRLNEALWEWREVAENS